MRDVNKRIVELLSMAKYHYISELCKDILETLGGSNDTKRVFTLLKVAVKEVFKEDLVIKKDEEGYNFIVNDEKLFKIIIEEKTNDSSDLVELFKRLNDTIENHR